MSIIADDMQYHKARVTAVRHISNTLVDDGGEGGGEVVGSV